MVVWKLWRAVIDGILHNNTQATPNLIGCLAATLEILPTSEPVWEECVSPNSNMPLLSSSTFNISIFEYQPNDYKSTQSEIIQMRIVKLCLGYLGILSLSFCLCHSLHLVAKQCINIRQDQIKNIWKPWIITNPFPSIDLFLYIQIKINKYKDIHEILRPHKCHIFSG